MEKELILDVFSKRLTQLVNEYNNIPYLMDKLGVKSKSTIYRYMNGQMNPKLPTVLSMAEIYNVNPVWLMGYDVPMHSDNQKNKTNKVLIYGTIPAGIPIECIEDIIDVEEITEDMLKGDKEFFGLKIKGNSMEPDYRDGDVVLFKKQNDCENGDDCVVMVNGNEGTFKRVKKKEDGITLQPLNPNYDPITFTNEEIEKLPVKILGVFEELRRKKKK